tara:strand:- start:262 stop:471 length:210 start_codon:yes stop_codon:yes gene_type:complete
MMKLSQLITYWDPEDAFTIITFLDELRDVLWAVYGEEIVEHHRVLQQEQNDRNNQQKDDPLIDDDMNMF